VGDAAGTRLYQAPTQDVHAKSWRPEYDMYRTWLADDSARSSLYPDGIRMRMRIENGDYGSGITSCAVAG